MTVAHSSENPKLSVIIPAYNERRRLSRTLEQVRAYAIHSGLAIEVIVVDDGSTDGTADVLAEPNFTGIDVRVLVNEANRGKGYSVRRGMLEARGEMLLLSDADMSTPIDQVNRLRPWIDDGYGIVIGSRSMPDSDLDPPQPPLRRLFNILFRCVRGAIMLPDIRDTQCGFKLFSRAAAQDVFTRQRSNGFAFDCEVLGLGRKLGHRIREVGVVWRDDRDSTIRPLRVALPMLWSLVKIRRRLAMMDEVSAAAESPPVSAGHK